MQKLPSAVRQLLHFVPSLLVTFTLGLLLNTYYQAKQHYDALLPRGRIAVFIAKNAQASHQAIGEKLMNIAGVGGAVYISQDKALESAMKDAPALKEVLITGDNPFTPYFMVEPKDMSFSMAQWLKSQLTAVQGVEEVRLDTNTFNIIDRLGVLRQFYGVSVSVIVMLGAFLALFKFVTRWMYRLIDYRHYLRMALGGIVTGVLGAGMYYLVSRYAVGSPVTQLPSIYFVLMAAGGVLAALAEEY